MSTDEQRACEVKPSPARSLDVRVLAARAAVTASEKAGRPVEPLVQELAELKLPGDSEPQPAEASRWRRLIAALLPNR